MPSPGSCSRCNRKLTTDRDGELCPVCAAAEATRSAAPAQVGAANFDPTRSPNHGAATDDFIPNGRPYLPDAPPGYDLIRRLGIGGMGTVYLAHERAAERRVAIKFLNSPSNPAAFERFLVEARALARLDHPNIVKVIAVETNWREPFLTMEYADGGTLADLAAPQGLLPPADAARLLLAATEAVAAAHAADILHRDIKPSNILLQKDEGRRMNDDSAGPSSSLIPHPSSLRPKVSDFGLAKRTDRDDGLTLTARPMGTPRYMSPEAAAGRYAEVGPTADVYGLGATLYHLLTGKPPFDGETTEQIVAQVVNELPVRPRALRPDLPADLEGVVVKAMEKDATARYPTATALADDLRRFLAGESTEAPLLSRRRRAWRWLGRNRNRIGAAIGVVFLATALVALGMALRPKPDDAEKAIRDEIAAGKTVRLLTADGRPRAPAWPLGPEELHSTSDDGGTCSFQATETRVLLLLSDPGVDSYRIEAEICQMRKLKDGQPNNDVGLVLAYAGQDEPHEIRVHSMMVLGFNEPGPGDRPGDKRELTLQDVGGFSGPPWIQQRSFFMTSGVPPIPLSRSESGEPLWRPVFAEVSPSGIRIPGRAGPQLIGPETILEGRTVLGDKIAEGQTVPVAPLPDWSPRMPLGIWCRGSWVSIRNVTVVSIR